MDTLGSTTEPSRPTTNPTTVVVESFGYLHGPAPQAHLTLDVRDLLYNPHTDPALRELTGLDPVMRDHVMGTAGTEEILLATYTLITEMVAANKSSWAPVRVAFGCAGGRHRSVVLSNELHAILTGWGVNADVSHRDIVRPVVQR